MTDTTMNTGAASLSDDPKFAAVMALIDRIINGSRLDENNHNDDSLVEVASHLSRIGEKWAARSVGSVYNDARALKNLLLDGQHEGIIAELRTIRDNFARAASTSANVAQGAAAVATVKVYETYTGQNGWIEVTQEEYDRTKDKYEHRILRVPAPPAQTALSDDARECLMDVVSHHHDFRTACIEIKAANETTRSDELYWQKQIDVLDRMKAQAERALTAAQSASGDAK